MADSQSNKRSTDLPDSSEAPGVEDDRRRDASVLGGLFVQGSEPQ